MAASISVRRRVVLRSGPGVPPPADLLSVLLIVAVLAPVGIVFGQLGMWHGFAQPWPFLLGGALCCGLAATQLRPLPWLLLTALLGVGAAAFFLMRAMPGPGLTDRLDQTRGLLGHWAHMVRDGEAVRDNRAVNFWTALAAWTTGMWAAWAGLRAGWHWLVLGLMGAVLVSTTSYLPGWPPEGLALFTFAALLLVARLHHRTVASEVRLRGERTPLRRLFANHAIHAAAVAVGAAALVGAAWLVPAVRWHAPAAWQLRPHTLQGGLSVSLGAPSGTLHDFGSQLPFVGPIALDAQPVANVRGVAAPGLGQLDLSGGLYLSGASYDHYSSDGWSSLADGAPLPPVESLFGTARADGRNDGRWDAAGLPEGLNDLFAAQATVWTERPQRTILAVGSAVNVAREPADPLNNNLHVQYLRLQSAPPGEATALTTDVPLSSGTTYMSAGSYSTATPAQLRSAGALTAADAWLRANYLQIPSSLPQRVRTLAASVTAGATTDYDRAIAVRNYLLGFTYDENIAAPPSGEDGVDYLLFVTRRGYCDYFASAMAMMLRSVGVPSRVVAGYVARDQNSDGSYTVRDKDAHAWVEAYFPGYGWQRFDPTPGGASPNGAAAATIVAPQPTATPAAAAAVTQDPSQPARDATKLSAPARRSFPFGLLAAIVALGAAVAAGGWALRRWLRNTRRAALTGWAGTSAAGRLAWRRRAPSETVGEYASALAAANSHAGGAGAIAAAHDRARYGPPDAATPLPARFWPLVLRTTAGIAAGWLRRLFRVRG